MPGGVWGREAMVPRRDFPRWRQRRRPGRGQWAEERWPREKAFVPLSRTESSPRESCSEMEPTRKGEGKGAARDGAAEDGCSVQEWCWLCMDGTALLGGFPRFWPSSWLTYLRSYSPCNTAFGQLCEKMENPSARTTQKPGKPRERLESRAQGRCSSHCNAG